MASRRGVTAECQARMLSLVHDLINDQELDCAIGTLKILQGLEDLQDDLHRSGTADRRVSGTRIEEAERIQGSYEPPRFSGPLTGYEPPAGAKP